MENVSKPNTRISVVLDSNVYIHAINETDSDCLALVKYDLIYLDVMVPLRVLLEADNNLDEEDTKKLYDILRNHGIEPDYQRVPEEMIQRYEALGCKKGDAVIAAYTELIGADYLVTQNRRFLKDVQGLPFTVIEAAQAVRLVSPEEEG